MARSLNREAEGFTDDMLTKNEKKEDRKERDARHLRARKKYPRSTRPTPSEKIPYQGGKVRRRHVSTKHGDKPHIRWVDKVTVGKVTVGDTALSGRRWWAHHSESAVVSFYGDWYKLSRRSFEKKARSMAAKKKNN